LKIGNIHNSIKIRIIAVVLLGFSFVVGIIITYSSNVNKTISIVNAEHTTMAQAGFYAERTKLELENALSSSQHLAQTLASAKISYQTEPFTRFQVISLLRSLLLQNSHYLGVGTFWEPNSFDGLDSLYASTEKHDSTGAFIPYWYADGKGGIGYDAYSPCFTSDFYINCKKTKKNIVLEPYMFLLDGEEVPTTTFASPILIENKYYGLAGYDISLNGIQDIVNKATLFEKKAFIAIISYHGTVVASTIEGLKSGSNLDSMKLKGITTNEIQQAISTTTYIKNMLVARTPIVFGNTETPWQLMINVPKEWIVKEAEENRKKEIFISLVLLVVILVVLFLYVHFLLKPIDTVAYMAQTLAQGKLFVKHNINTNSLEITELASSFTLLNKRLQELSNFAENIGKGNFNINLETPDEEDILGNSLVEMRRSLLLAKAEEDKRHAEDEQRNWANIGFAIFTTFFQAKTGTIETLSEQILKKLVRYVNANQGGIFILEEDENNRTIVLQKAAFAYDRKKIAKKNFFANEGLIGRCIQEKETIYLTDIPLNYIEITSGLGDSPPTALLIVPMKYQHKIIGVIEIASFTAFENYVIQFVERIAENAAATFAALITSSNTEKLYKEVKQKNEQFEVKEAQLQEKLDSYTEKNNQLLLNHTNNEWFLNLIEDSFFKVTINFNGTITNVNSLLCKYLNINEKQITGKNFSEIDELSKNMTAYENFFRNLHIQKKMFRTVNCNFFGKAFSTTGIFVIQDINNNKSILWISILQNEE